MADARVKKDIFFDTAIAPGAPAGIAIHGDMVKHVMVGGDVGGMAQASTGAMHSFTMALPGPGNPENAKTESLGSQVIDGVRADGTRTTITIPANAIGNDLPIEIVSERWYSPELQTVVMTKRNDPRMGETTGFLKWEREAPTRRPVPLRVRDWREVYEPFPAEKLQIQAGRCMDCGIRSATTGVRWAT